MSMKEMNLKRNIKEWKEPWKKKEPGMRRGISERSKLDYLRLEMEQGKQPQQLKITCNKNLLLPVGLFKSFNVNLRYPLTQKQFKERMRVAFPELDWEGS